jgi:hypothetical protein
VNSRTDSNISLTITLYVFIATAATYLIGKSTIFDSSTLPLFQIGLSKASGLLIFLSVFGYILNQLYEKCNNKVRISIPVFSTIAKHFDSFLLLSLFLINCIIFILILSDPILRKVIAYVVIIIFLNYIILNLYVGFTFIIVSVQILVLFSQKIREVLMKIYNFLDYHF